MEEHDHHADPGRLLRSSARELERAAGDVQRHARAFAPAAATPGTLAHVEEALHRLETAVCLMAGETAELADEADPGGNADALRWHLVAAARGLEAARHACSASRHWAHELSTADSELPLRQSHEALEPEALAPHSSSRPNALAS